MQSFAAMAPRTTSAPIHIKYLSYHKIYDKYPVRIIFFLHRYAINVRRSPEKRDGLQWAHPDG